MKERILIVEDSRAIADTLGHLVQTELDCSPIVKHSMAAAAEVIGGQIDNVVAAVLDLNLPDAPHGEVVDLYLDNDVPVIVLTGSIDGKVRDRLIKKGVVDYVLKESRISYDYVIRVIRRLLRDRTQTAVIVDDSPSLRQYLRSLLQRLNYNVVEAANGEQALELIAAHPDTRLVLTDYLMPGMDGIELLRRIRKNHSMGDLAVIALSSHRDDSVSALFIKNGANDFLKKPFSYEEFQCRIMATMENLDYIDQIRDQANRDYLTRLFNRRYFFQVGCETYRSAVDCRQPLSLAMVDIDYFKRINDIYGHDVGDEALKAVAALLTEGFSDELVARLGGEEFVVLFAGVSGDEARQRCETFRREVEEKALVLSEGALKMTVSIGLTGDPGDSLEGMLKRADECLYRAKASGRNRTCCAADSD